MRNRRIVIAALVAVFPLLVSPCLWASPLPAPGSAEAPAAVPAGAGVQAPAPAPATPDPASRLQELTLPVLHEIDTNVQPLGGGCFSVCQPQCGPDGGFPSSSGFCLCCA